MKINDSEFKDIVASSYSIRKVIQKCGLIPAGGNYSTVKKRIENMGLDTSHFRGQGWLRGQTNTHAPKQPLDNLLVAGSHYQSYKLKNRLLKEGIKKHKCECCGMAEWEGYIIPLEMHHIDGDSTNNQIENIQLICPNCHSLTDNYRGRNIGRCGGTR